MMRIRLIESLLLCASPLLAHAESLFKIPKNATQELPAGVPRTVDTNGRVISIDGMFTTEAYQNEALRLVIREANKVAKEMNLPEALPISESTLTRAYIGPFGFNYQLGAVGNITTSNYWYFVKRGQKFSDLTIADYDDYYVKYQDEKHQVPLRELNPKAAYRLATQWLATAHMDVQGLNRDCKLHIDLTTDMLPGFAESKEKKTRSRIVPLYFVSWRSKNKTENSGGSVAYVELYLPKKQLLQLSVEDPKYILRPPLVFTNLAALFPGKATITTNRPGKVIVIDGSKWPTDSPTVVHSLAAQISNADRIVCTNLLNSGSEPKGSLTVSGARAKRIVKAISTATRLETGTNSMWDWQLQFYAGTNLLAAIRFQGKVFLAENGEFADESGELEKLYGELLAK